MTPAESWLLVLCVTLSAGTVAALVVWWILSLFANHYANDGEFETDYCDESKKPGMLCFCNQCNRARHERIENGHFYCRTCGCNQVTKEGAQCVECFRRKGLMI